MAEGILVFDTPDPMVLVTDEDADGVSEVLVMEATETEPVVVMEDGEPAALVLQAGGRQGPQGPAGTPGAPGEPGAPGADGAGSYYEEFSFASPSTVWTVVHNRDTFGLNVETVDTSGEPVEGYVTWPDANTVEIEWYYPQAGAARVFR